MEQVLTDNPDSARSILGTDDPRAVRAGLDALCKGLLGSGVSDVLLCTLSSGCSFGVLLHDGRRVYIKAHPPGRPARYLRAVHAVQAHLYRRGFPAPRPLAGPAPFGAGLATADEFVDRGAFPDGHHPDIRRAMARSLYRLTELAGELPVPEGLDRGWNWPGPRQLWPEPHSRLYDFEATSGGARRIDEVAARAKALVDAFEGGERVVGHADWSVDQVRFEGGALAVVYDWDSLRPEKESVIVGIAASNFTSTWHAAVPDPPSPRETRLFVRDYERARGAPFAGEERRAIAGAAVYAIAYLARCEHALDSLGRRLEGSFREALPVHAKAYLPPALPGGLYSKKQKP